MRRRKIKVERFAANPLIVPAMLAGTDGGNINGPSLIAVPEWVESPLGKYYLYFAHHQGKYIRMAYADALEGPWTVYTPGVLHLRDTMFEDGPVADPNWYAHIASPDIVIDHDRQQFIMYFHGMGPGLPGRHCSSIAVSKNGLSFAMPADAPIIDGTYLRAFSWQNTTYCIGRLGVLYRAVEGTFIFERGPNPFLRRNRRKQLRHAAVRIAQDRLQVFYSRIGDRPERILMSELTLSQDWTKWRASRPTLILRPEFDYEGVALPRKKSREGHARRPLHEVRDPAIFEDDGRTFLLYSVKGEFGIAIAEVISI